LRIVVTGSAGMLGRAVMKETEEDHEVRGVDIADLDLADTSCIEALVEMRPHAVCHLAAFTDVDGCESDPERAYRSNVLATRNVAVACKESGCPMLYVSTDYVFDGKAGEPYSEDAEPRPLNMYGRTKLIGEWFVERHAPEHCIVRSSWLFGEGGRNFVETILELAEKQDSISVVRDQRGSPTYAGDLAAALKRILEEGRFGIFHVTNGGDCTWHDFAIQILEFSGITDCRVEAIGSAELRRAATRPAYSVLDNGLYRKTFGSSLRDYRDALRDYLSRRSGGAKDE
jgi:dTDP-4-dehydrorhamnose reductase